MVADLTESGKYLCSLRYALTDGENVRKFDTATARDFLKKTCPHYLHFSEKLDVLLEAVPAQAVKQVLHPQDAVKRLVNYAGDEKISRAAGKVIRDLASHGADTDRLGITGSVLLGFQNESSDIDFVVYGQQAFARVRDIIRTMHQENAHCRLDAPMWAEAWQRRACDLDLAEYIKYETRKFNKLNYDGVKIDFSCVPENSLLDDVKYPVKKSGVHIIRARVIDDSDIFSSPAIYRIDHEEIGEILVYTATYAGQAFSGETIEARGPVEIDGNGMRRMVIGTSREASGEYLRVTGQQFSNKA